MSDIKAHPLPEDKVPHASRAILAIWQQPPWLAQGGGSGGSKGAATAAAVAAVLGGQEVAWKWDILRAV